jgi:hypothetical protein
VRHHLSRRYLVAAAALAVVTSACSSPAATTPATHVKATTNTGVCKLVPPSVVATALEESMSYPSTLTHSSTTECVYRALHTSGAAVIVRFDMHTNASTFAKYRTSFERRGLKLGPVTDLGDVAYYFAEQTAHTTVTTVVSLKGSLQVLVTGTGSLDAIGSIARYTLAQYEAAHPANDPPQG